MDKIPVSIEEELPTFEQRINRLLDPRNLEKLEFLMVTPEFRGARFKLLMMKERLDSGEDLRDDQDEYLRYVETHFKNIHPHVEIVTVNGEDTEVVFYTMPADCSIKLVTGTALEREYQDISKLSVGIV